jgi:hypothetical protein
LTFGRLSSSMGRAIATEFCSHSRKSGNPFIRPHRGLKWIPAFAGMTTKKRMERGGRGSQRPPRSWTSLDGDAGPAPLNVMRDCKVDMVRRCLGVGDHRTAAGVLPESKSGGDILAEQSDRRRLLPVLERQRSRLTIPAFFVREALAARFLRVGEVGEIDRIRLVEAGYGDSGRFASDRQIGVTPERVGTRVLVYLVTARSFFQRARLSFLI